MAAVVDKDADELKRIEALNKTLDTTLTAEHKDPIVFKLFKSDNNNCVLYKLLPIMETMTVPAEHEDGTPVMDESNKPVLEEVLTEVGIEVAAHWFKANPPDAALERKKGNHMLISRIVDPCYRKLYGVELVTVKKQTGDAAAIAAIAAAEATMEAELEEAGEDDEVDQYRMRVDMNIFKILGQSSIFPVLHILEDPEGGDALVGELRANLDGVPSRLIEAYVHMSAGLFGMPNIDSVNIYGQDLVTGEWTSTVIVPPADAMAAAAHVLFG